MAKPGLKMCVYFVELLWSLTRGQFSAAPFLTGLADFVQWHNRDGGETPISSWPLDLAHVRFHTKNELQSLLGLWESNQVRGFNVLMIGAEGTPGHIQFKAEVPEDDVSQIMSARDMATILAGKGKDCGIIVSACRFMNDKDAAQELLAKSGAQFLFGYTTDVDWIESCLLEVALLKELRFRCDNTRPSTVRKAIERVHSRFSQLWQHTGAMVMFRPPRNKKGSATWELTA